MFVHAIIGEFCDIRAGIRSRVSFNSGEVVGAVSELNIDWLWSWLSHSVLSFCGILNFLGFPAGLR